MKKNTIFTSIRRQCQTGSRAEGSLPSARRGARSSSTHTWPCRPGGERGPGRRTHADSGAKLRAPRPPSPVCLEVTVWKRRSYTATKDFFHRKKCRSLSKTIVRDGFLHNTNGKNALIWEWFEKWKRNQGQSNEKKIFATLFQELLDYGHEDLRVSLFANLFSFWHCWFFEIHFSFEFFSSLLSGLPSMWRTVLSLATFCKPSLVFFLLLFFYFYEIVTLKNFTAGSHWSLNLMASF